MHNTPHTPPQKSQTYINTSTTAAKKPNHTLHPTPVLSAMTIIRFIVPRSRSRVRSNPSFILSASADESRISSPIAIVICVIPNHISTIPVVGGGRGG